MAKLWAGRQTGEAGIWGSQTHMKNINQTWKLELKCYYHTVDLKELAKTGVKSWVYILQELNYWMGCRRAG